MRVTVYLKTPLFAVGHVPENAWVLEATTGSPEAVDLSGGMEFMVSAYRDASGRPLDGEALRLFVPNSKIDHVQVHG